MNGRASALGLLLVAGMALGAEVESTAPAPAENRPTLKESLAKKVAERNGLLTEIASLKQQRTIFLAYDLIAAIAALWLGRRLLGGSEKRKEAEALAAPAATAEKPDGESDPFGDEESAAPQQPKTGRATITVRDGSTQAVVASGHVETRRVVKRTSAAAADRSEDTQATRLPKNAQPPEEGSDRQQVRTSRRSKSASFTAPATGGDADNPGNEAGSETKP